MKKTLLALLIGLAARASTSEFRPVNESQFAKALGKYQSLTLLHVRFKQKKILKDMNLPLVSEGELTLKPPNEVIYSLIKPSRLVVTLTPTLITIDAGTGSGERIQKIKADMVAGEREKADLQAMVTWLKLDAKALTQNYDITTDNENHFHFLPHAGLQSPFDSLEMTLSQQGHVAELVMHEPSGDRIEFAFETPEVSYGPQ